MTVVVFSQSKGGCGKSTLARALACEGVRNSLSVKIADLDLANTTSMDWVRRRLANDIKPQISVEAFKTSQQALRSAEDLDLLVVDAPGRASEGTLNLALAADLLIQPTNPSIDDLQPGVRVFHELVKAGVPRERLCFAMTMVLTEAEEAAARAYIEKAGYDVLAGSIPSRQSYRDAQNGGRSIIETRYPALNQRADEVIESIIARIEV